MTLKNWLLVIRTPFLLLSCTLVFLGGALALYTGIINTFNVILALIGLLLLHISVNVLNEYYDYKFGTDFLTKKTPFSGGSGVLPAGLINPSKVLLLGLISFSIAAVIGIYFLYTVGTLLIPILVLGAIFTLLYTQFLARCMLGEISAGLGLGTLPILGVFIVATGEITLEAVAISIIPGITTFNLLLLNEFPDVEADKVTGRKNLVTQFGYEKCSKIYSILLILLYIYLFILIVLKVAPPYLFIAYLTLPLANKNIKILMRKFTQEELLYAMKNNTILTLTIPTLLAIGYIIATITLQ